MHYLEKYSKLIEEEIRKNISDIEPTELYKSSAHLIEAGGKRIRPSLVLLSTESVGGKIEDALNAATAIELIHTFSLIHDDIMDKDEVRRGRATVHVIWGEPLAILAGDVLFSKAFEVMLKSNIDEKRLVKVLDVMTKACVNLCKGQAYDMLFEKNFEVKEKEYLEMIYYKTASLIAASTKIGAIIGNGSKEEINALYNYGKFLGLAFQIHDDYLDIAGDEKQLGKPVGSDIVEGKMTLIAIKALNEANKEDREKLISILQSGDEKK